MRLLWVAFGWGCVGLAVLGAVLPVLPTTPFLLLAAWAFHRGSPRWARWLEAHRLFGPLLRDWREHRVIPRHAKVAAVSMMAASLAYLALWSTVSAAAVAVIAAVMLGSAAWMVWCPSARPDPGADPAIATPADDAPPR